MNERYHAAIEEARRQGLALTAEQERDLLALLEEYAREIEARMAAGLELRGAEQVLREISLLIDEMSRELAAAVGDGIRLTAARLAEIQAVATAELLASAGSRLSAGAFFTGTGARAAQAILARPELAEAFVTIRSESKQAANRILRRGVLRGAPARAIARELRQFVAAPGSLLEGDFDLLRDRRRIGYAAVQELGYAPTPENLMLVRKEAGRIAYRASTIARTEIMQAEAEVLVQGAIDSPVVALVEIRLSYRHSEPCACEPIVQADLFGFGPGRYDPRQVPPRPHPRCWCPRRHVLRPESEWGAERGPLPDPVRDLESVAEAAEISPSARAAFVRAIETGMRRDTLQTAEVG